MAHQADPFSWTIIDAVDLADLVRLRGIAAELHRRTGRTAMPDPLRLAAAEGVAMAGGPETLALEDRALFRCSADPREEGLWIAFALAVSILLRRGIPYSEAHAWTLALNLLVPDWIFAGRALDDVIAQHVHAPAWLVGVRWRLRAA